MECLFHWLRGLFAPRAHAAASLAPLEPLRVRRAARPSLVLALRGRRERAPRGPAARVVDDCPGLLVGDVLRACSTFQLKPGTAFGLFASAVPARCLFLADGKTPDEVIKALTENTVERTSEVTMIFERPKQ